MNQIKDIWNRLSPEKKKLSSLIIFAVLLSTFGFLGFKAKQSKNIEKKENRKLEEIRLDEDQLEKGLYSQAKEIQDLQDQQLKLQDERIDQNEKKMDDVLKAIHDLKDVAVSPLNSKKAAEASSIKPAQVLKTEEFKITPPPAPNAMSANAYMNYPGSGTPPPPRSETKLIGGISLVKNDSFKPEKDKEESDKKKTEEIYLPPSFMAATLLSGVTAQTTSAGKNDPLPLLFRIRELAILPNQVKANLKGCFVIGEGHGRLSDERVHVRLNTLSCVAKNGSAVIDQSIKGWVTDADGKIGLSGNVVAKMGTHLARSALAGFIGGIGEGMELSTKSASFANNGQATEIFSNTDTKNILKLGIGSGISKAAEELQKFYLELASQTLPIIEVGATKDLTLVISEGVILKLKTQRVGR